ncbi:MAG TPA: S8 family serine peptidase, partial [Candidatus Binataceae bacterium]
MAFQNGVPTVSEQAIIASVGVELKRIGVGVHVVRVPPGRVHEAIRLLSARGEIRYAEPDYMQSVAGGGPNDTNFGVQWAFQNTGQTVNGTSGTAGADERAVPAWTVSTGGNAVVAAVLDTGVQYSHPDLATNMWNNPGGIGGCPAGTHGYDALSSSCDPMDDDTAYGGHGSHIAGIIGAVGNNAAGVTGANWTASIMAVKWLQSNGGTVGLDSNLISGMDWIINAKKAGVNVRVVNDSATWPGTGFSQAVSDEIDLLGSNDILFVTAAGNTGQNNDSTPRYPCSYNRPNMICVAMTDQKDNLSLASNYGLNSVELAAPGANIFSTLCQSNYGYISGTSMSAGQVSGSAALILSLGYQSVANLKSTILASVDQLPSLTNFVTTGGRLNLCKALGCSSGATAVPAILSAPQITGIVQFGSVIGASTGLWSGKPTSFSYQWYRCNNGCQLINGATSSSYAVLADADVGSTMTVSVTASNTAGSATASSAASAAVASVTPPFTINATISDGAVLSGKVTWQSWPVVPVHFVEFFIDGVLAQTDPTSPYIYNGSTTGVLDTTTLSNGTHVLGIVALAYSDNETYSFKAATVTINNQVTPTPTPTPIPSSTPTRTPSRTPTTNHTVTPTPIGPTQTPVPTPTPMPGQIMFVSAGSGVTSGGSPTSGLSVPAPASIQTNDLIVVQATDYWGNAVNPPDLSWHLIRVDSLANHAVVRSFWHLATGAGDGP